MSLLTYFIAINVVTFTTYSLDKIAAMNGDWRVSERSMIGMNLFGGFVGGWLAFFLLNHKTQHAIFWLMQSVATALWIAGFFAWYR